MCSATKLVNACYSIDGLFCVAVEAVAFCFNVAVSVTNAQTQLDTMTK